VECMGAPGDGDGECLRGDEGEAYSLSWAKGLVSISRWSFGEGSDLMCGLARSVP